MVQKILKIGSKEINLTIGDSVTKITPETYEEMNREFEEEGLAFRIIVPTQEQIDDWQKGNRTEYSK